MDICIYTIYRNVSYRIASNNVGCLKYSVTATSQYLMGDFLSASRSVFDQTQSSGNSNYYFERWPLVYHVNWWRKIFNSSFCVYSHFQSLALLNISYFHLLAIFETEINQVFEKKTAPSTLKQNRQRKRIFWVMKTLRLPKMYGFWYSFAQINEIQFDMKGNFRTILFRFFVDSRIKFICVSNNRTPKTVLKDGFSIDIVIAQQRTNRNAIFVQKQQVHSKCGYYIE